MATATMSLPPGLGARSHGDPGPPTPARRTALLAWVGLVLLLLAQAFRALLVTLLAVAMVPLLWNWSSYVVRSGSMEPALSVGDVVVAQPLGQDARIPLGKVMLFTPPNAPPGEQTRLHRVVENLGQNSYTTAGDANRTDDPEPVPAENFLARPVLAVPFVALPLTWAYAGDFVRLVAFMAITMLALYFSTRPPCDPRHRRRKELSRARRLAAKSAGVLRRALVPVTAAVAVVVVASTGLPAEADAAFSATTTNRDLAWKVSGTLAHRVSLAFPGEAVRGTVALTAALENTDGRAYSVRMEYSPAGAAAWQPVCTDASAPYTCSWRTTGLANGRYDLRAVASSGETTLTSPVVKDTVVDNTAPTVTMQDPGTPLRGTATFAATASDALSGVDRVVVQYAAFGSSTYQDLCSTTAAPYSCAVDTSTLPDGTYTFRAIATDAAGNSTTSVTVPNRVVDNSVTSVVMNDPGAVLSGTEVLSATASSSAGVTSVRIQGTSAGTAGWTDLCTDTSSPYSCSYNTALASDGLYDLRAVLVDRAGRTTVSATVANRRVDNTPPRASDVQTTNGGTTGRLDSGDTMSLTYSEEMKHSSISSGWNGSALGVTLRLRDGNLLGLGSSGDSVDVLRGGSTVSLGSVNLRGDYISSYQTAQFAATMTASTTTVNGVTATRVTITVGAQTSGSVRTSFTSSTMSWTPSTAATDLAGLTTSSAAASESGAIDRQF